MSVLGAFGMLATLVGLFGLVAMPVAWFLATRWLQDYAYHVAISPVMAVGGAGVLIVLAMAVVAMQSASAASANPVENLRSE